MLENYAIINACCKILEAEDSYPEVDKIEANKRMREAVENLRRIQLNLKIDDETLRDIIAIHFRNKK